MPTNIKCPACKRALEIPDELMGKKVKCPACKLIFTATPGGSAPSTKQESSQRPAPRPKSEEEVRVRRKAPPPPEEDDEEEEEQEETPRVRKKPIHRREEDYEEEEEEEEDEDEEEEYRPRQKRRRFRRDMAPHRGAMVLTLGILSLVICGLLGPFAWIMGRNDLEKMDAGRMDPSGEGLTKAGKICGIIGTVLGIIGCIVGVLQVILILGFGQK
jgi:hypothetical protein